MTLLGSARSFAQSTFSYLQAPIFDGGAAFSDGSFVRWADDFRLPATESIRSITWWGTHPAADDFFFAIYSDEAGKPGVLIPGGSLATWSYETTHSHMGRDFQYVGVLKEPVELSGGTRYWLSIVHPPVGSWDWTGARSHGSAAFQMNGGVWILQPDSNVAFGLSIEVPEPRTSRLLLLGLAGLWWFRGNNTTSKV